MDSLQCLLADATETLRVQAPWHHAALCRALGGRTVEVRLDTEKVWLGPGLVLGVDDQPTVFLEATTTAVLAVVDGHETLAAAARGGRLLVRAPRADLSDLHRAWTTFVHGLVRCPAAPFLLVRLRGRVPAHPRGPS